jgi:hypothetical protein
MKWQHGPQTEHFFLNRFKPINLEAEERGSNKYRYGTTTTTTTTTVGALNFLVFN